MKRRIIAGLMAGVLMATTVMQSTYYAGAAEIIAGDEIIEEIVEDAGSETQGSPEKDKGQAVSDVGAGETEVTAETEEAEMEGTGLLIDGVELVEADDVPEEVQLAAPEEKAVDQADMVAGLYAASSAAAPELADMTELTLGQEEDVEITAPGEAVWFKFTAPETETYVFRSSSAEGLDAFGTLYSAESYQDGVDGYLSEDDDSAENMQFLITYPLEAGAQVCLKARLRGVNDTGSFKVSVEKKKEPAEITEIRNLKTVFPENLDSNSFSAASVVLSYVEGESETVSLANCDSYGNYVDYRLTDAEGAWHFIEGGLRAGTYTLSITCGETASTSREITVKSMEEYLQDDSVGKLALESTITVDQPVYRGIYDFCYTAESEGSYCFHSSAESGTLMLYSQSGELIDEITDDEMIVSGTCGAGESMLLRLKYEEEAPEEQIEITANRGAAVSDFTLNLPETEVYHMNKANYTVTLKYTDENLPEQTVPFRYQSRDSYGNEVSYDWYGSGEGNIGVVTYTVSCGGQTKTGTVNVVSRLNSDIEFATAVPEETTVTTSLVYALDSWGEETAYLKLTPELSGDYQIVIEGECRYCELIDDQEKMLTEFSDSRIWGLEQGKSYLLYARGSEGNTVTFSIQKVNSVREITVLSAAEKMTNWYEWMEQVIWKAVYEDGTEETVTGLDYVSDDGRVVSICTLNENGVECDEDLFDTEEGPPYGKYTIEISLGLAKTTVPLEYVSGKDLAIEVSEGTNSLGTSWSSGYVKYTAAQTGCYRFSTSVNGNLSQVGEESCFGYLPHSVYLENGTTVWLNVYTADESGEEITVTVEKIPGISEIALDIPEVLAGYNCLARIETTYTYTDGSVEAESGGLFQDSIGQYGYSNEVSLKYEDGSEYDTEEGYYSVAPGTYLLTVSAGGASVEATIQILADWENSPVLNLGENVISDGFYYQFTTDADVSGYQFLMQGGYGYIQLEEASGNMKTIGSFFSTGSPGEAFMLQPSVRYRIEFNLDEGEDGFLTITKVPAVENISVQSVREHIWAGIDNFSADMFQVSYTDADGTERSVSGSEKDSYGYSIQQVSLYDKNGNSISTVSEAGDYSAVVTFAGQTYSVPISAELPNTEEIPELTLNTEEAGTENSKVFWFSPETDGNYRFTIQSGWAYLYDGETLTSAELNSGTAYELKGSHLYYIRVEKYSWEETWKLLADSCTVVSSYEIVEKQTEFAYGDSGYLDSLKLQVNYGDDNIQEIVPSEQNWTDAYGNRITYTITDASGIEAAANRILPAGTYTVSVTLGDITKTYSVTISDREIPMLSQGEQTLTIPVGETMVYALPDVGTKRIRIALQGEGYSLQYRSGTADNMEYNWIYANSDIWIKTDKTAVTYLALRNESETAELPVTLSGIEELSVKVLKETIPAGELAGWVRGEDLAGQIQVEKTYAGQTAAEALTTETDEHGYWMYYSFWQDGKQVQLYAAQPGTVTIEVILGWANYTEAVLGTYEITLTDGKAAATVMNGSATLEAEAGSYYMYQYTPETTETYKIALSSEAGLYWEGTDSDGQYYLNSDSGTSWSLDMKAGEPFYFRVCPKASGTMTIDVVPASGTLTCEVEEGTWTYTGEEIRPSVTVKNSIGKVLSDSQYEVNYEDNTNSGTAKVTITGKGLYEGKTAEAYFSIGQKDISDESMEVALASASLTYNNSSQQPVFTVTDTARNQQLNYGNDYMFFVTGPEEQPEDTVTVGQKFLVISGMTNYCGTRYVPYEILAKDINTLSVIELDNMAAYRPGGVTMNTILADGQMDYQLAEGKDYEVRYENNTEPGTAKIILTGIGNFTGTLEHSFTITALDLSLAEVEEISDQWLTGFEVHPELTVILDGSTLVQDQDYTVAWTNCVDSGTAVGVLQGIGGYTGTKEISFTIMENAINESTIREAAKSLTENVTSARNGEEGILWYTWDVSETGNVFLLTRGDNTETPRLYRGEDGRVFRQSGATWTNADGTGMAVAVTQNYSYYVQLMAGQESLLVLRPVTLEAGITSEQTAVETAAAWSFTPEVSGTYQLSSDTAGVVKCFAESQVMQDDIVLEAVSENAGFAGSVNLAAGARYLFLWEGQAENRTLKIELTEAHLETLEEGVNSIYLPAGAEMTYVLPAAAGKRYVYISGAVRAELSVLEGEETAAAYTAEGKVLPYYGQEETVQYLTLKNTSADAVTEIETGAVPEIVETLDSTSETPQIVQQMDTTKVPQVLLKDWVELASGYLIRSTYDGNQDEVWNSQYVKDGPDHYGYDTHVAFYQNDVPVEAGGIQTGEVTMKVSVSWREEAAVELGSCTVTVGTMEDLQEMPRGYSTSEIPGDKAGLYYFVPSVTGTYTLSFGLVAAMVSTDPEIGPEGTWQREIETTAGEKQLILLIPEGTDSTITYHLERTEGTAEFAVELSQTEMIFTGEALTPEVTVKDTVSGLVLREGVDYSTLQWEDNTNAGTAAVTLKGTGEYLKLDEEWQPVIVRQEFTILPAAIDNAEAPEKPAFTYTGAENSYEETLTFGTYQVQPEEYVVSLAEGTENMVDAGEKQLILTGRGNFTGIKTVSCEILPRSIADGKLEITGSYRYTGKEIEPEVTVTVDGKLLQEGEYDASFSDNILPGTATVTVTGKGNYTGELTKSFQISKADITEMEFAPIPDQIYTGMAIEPIVTVKNGEIDLTENTDFTVEYENNTEIGTAQVTVTGIGCYTKAYGFSFEIVNETVPVSEAENAAPLLIGERYEAAGEQNWYVLEGSEERLLYLEANGNTASSLKLFVPKTENELQRVRPESQTLTGEGGTWWLKVPEQTTLYFSVPENLSLEVTGSQTAELETDLAAPEDGTGWAIYRLNGDSAGNYRIFTTDGISTLLFGTKEGVFGQQQVSFGENHSYVDSDSGQPVAARYPYLKDQTLEAGEIIYVALTGDGQGSVWNMPFITSLELMPGTALSRYRRFDQGYFEGTQVKLTYSDGTTGELEAWDRDAWGRTVSYLLDGQECVDGETGTFLLESGTHRRSILPYAEDGNRAECSSETSFEVLPLTESYQENTVVLDQPFTLKTGETVELYPVTVEKDWKYMISANGAVTLRQYDENGPVAKADTGKDLEQELTAGTYYYQITSEEENVQVTVSEKTAPAAVESIAANGNINSIRVTWSIAVELDTGYRIYRRADGEDEFALVKSIEKREENTWVDQDVEEGKNYEYYVLVTDGSYVVSAPSETVSATALVDDEPPLVTQLLPETGRINQVVTLKMTAKDNVGVARSRIEFSLDRETWALLAEEEGSSCSGMLDTTVYADQTVYVRALAYDEKENESTERLCQYQIDNSGPEQVTELTEEHTSVTVTLKWKDVADEDLQYFLVEEMQKNDEWKPVKEVRTLGANLTGLEPMTSYTYRVIAYDDLGNRGTESEEITVTTSGDTTSPVNSGISPKPGYFTTSIPLTLDGSDDYNVAKIELQVKTETGDWTSQKVWTYEEIQKRRTQEYTLDVSEVPEGKFRVRAIITDGEGHQSDTSNLAPFVEYVIDRTAPAQPSITKATGGNGYIELQWSQGAETDLNGYNVYRSAEKEGEYSLVAEQVQALNWRDRTAAPGVVWWYKTAACDLAGNVSTFSEAAGAAAVQDTKAPEIRSIYPAESAVLGSGYHTVSILIMDNTELAGADLWYTVEGQEEQKLFQNLSGSQANPQFVIPADQLAEGKQLTVRVQAEDAAGNISQESEVSYTMDLTAPEMVSVEASFDADQNAVVLNWESQEADDLAGYNIYRSVEGSDSWTLLGQTKAEEGTASGTYTDWNPAAEKITYRYRVETVDAVGNTSGLETEMVSLPDRSVPIAVIDCEAMMEQGVQYRISGVNSKDNTEIVSYELNMGDGTVYRTSEAVHTYQATGTYCIILTVTDSDGNTGSVEKYVTVKERGLLGTVQVLVQGTDGLPISDASVYFDLGEADQFVRSTGSDGIVTFTAEAGSHTIGCLVGNNEYLPQKKSVTVNKGDVSSLTFTMVEQPIVEGEFETHRMTLEEIQAAGIDIDDPENQYIVKLVVHLMYGVKLYDFEFLYNPLINKLLNPEPVDVEDGNGGHRIIYPEPVPPYPYPFDWGTASDTPWSEYKKISLGLLDVPVGTSMLKEFFDVKLHIINNADSEFSMLENQITLNVPSGLSVMETAGTQSSAHVEIPEIKGGTQETVNWILRGDQVGTYYLSADYAGTLSEFNSQVTAEFKAEEPIEVYGMSNMNLTMYVAQELKDDTLYFDLELENQGDLDVYCPDLYSDELSELLSQEYYDGGDEPASELDETVMKPGERLVRHYKRKVTGQLQDSQEYLKKYWVTQGETYGLKIEIVLKPLDYFAAAETVDLYFNSMGGTTVDPLLDLPKGKSLDEARKEEKYSSLKWPTAEKEGLYLVGWYTSQDYSGEPCDGTTVWEESVTTLYAKWSTETLEESELAAKVKKNQYGFHVVNSTGGSLKNVKVTFNGAEKTTDEDGNVIFKKPSEETVKLSAQKERYASYENDAYELLEQRYDILTLYSENENLDILTKVIYKHGISTANILKDKKRLIALKDATGLIPNLEFAIRCYLKASFIPDFEGMELRQDGKLIAQSQTVMEDGCVSFENLHIKDFDSGSGLYLNVIYRKDGREYRVKKNLNLEFVQQADDISFELGDGITLKVDPGVPLLGGMSLKLATPELPIGIKVSSDGTVRVGINLSEEVLNDEKKAESIGKLLNKVEDAKGFPALVRDSKKLNDKIDELKNQEQPKGELEWNVVGYLEGQLTQEGTFSKLEGHIIGTVSLSKKLSWQFPFAIPVTAQLVMKGEGEADGYAKYEFTADKWDLGVDLKLTAGLEGFVGAGLSGIAAAGGYASGETTLALKELVTPEEWTAKLGGGFKIYVGPFEYKWSIVEKTWYLYTRNSSRAARSIAENQIDLYNLEAYSYTDRTYLENQSDWLGEVSEVEDGTIAPLLTETYGASKPKTVTAGGTTLMVYIGDSKDANRTAANIGQLMYSIYRDGSWTAPQPVDDNDRADLSFDLSADGDTIYLTYQEADQVFDDTISSNPESYFAALGVVNAVFDPEQGKFTEFQKVTQEDTRYNFMPQTVANGSRQMTVWGSNEAADCFGMNSTNEIWMQMKENGTAAEAKAVQTGKNSITALKAGVLNGAFAVAYVMDEDNDLNTTTDRILYVMDESGTEKQLAIGSVADPQFTRVPGRENPVLVWYEDGSLNMLDTFDGTVQVLVDGSEIPVNAGYRIVGNYILYIGTAENGCGNVYAATYQDGVWKEPVFVTDETASIYEIDAVEIDGVVGLVMMQSTTDENSENHYTMSFLKLADRHELKLTSAEYDKEQAVPGAQLPISFTVKNIGTAQISTVEASVTDAAGTVYGQQSWEVDLSSSDETDLILNMQVPDSLDDTLFTLNVWESGTEVSEENKMSFQMNETDLAVSVETSKVGRFYEIIAEVKNQGYLASGGALKIYGLKNTNVAKECTVETLQPGESMIYTMSLDASTLEAAEDSLTIEIVAEQADYATMNNMYIDMIYRQNEVIYYAEGREWARDYLEMGNLLVFPEEPVSATKFLGWYSIKDGTKVEENTTLTDSIELEARFADPAYQITDSQGNKTRTDDQTAVISALADGSAVQVEILADVTVEGEWVVPAGSTVMVQKGVTLTIDASGNLSNQGTIQVMGTLENAGILTNKENMTVDGTFRNAGTMSNSGTLNSNGTTENTGAIDNSGSIYNSGAFASENGNVNGQGSFLNAGTVTGEANIAAGVSAHVHAWNSAYTVDVEATCSREGSKSRHCTVDGCQAKTGTVILPVTEHTYGEWKVVSEPTLAETGRKTRTCSVCGHVDTQEIPNLMDAPRAMDELLVSGWKGAYDGNSHTAEVTGLPEGGTITWSATEDGTVLEECPSYVKQGMYTVWYQAAAPGYETKEGSIIVEITPCVHQYSTDWTIDVEATEDTPGSRSHHCTVAGCDGKTDVTVIPSVGSVYADMQTKLTEEITSENAAEHREELENYVDVLLQEDSAAVVAEKVDMNTVKKLENLYLEAQPSEEGKVQVTQIEAKDAFGNSTEASVQVEGAALTAVSVSKNMAAETKVAAKLTVNVLAPGEVIGDEELKERVEQGEVSVFSITLSVVDADTGEMLEGCEVLQPKAPIRVTLPIPANLFGSTEFVLIHQKEDGTQEEMAYTLDKDAGTITFVTDSLSDFLLSARCTEHVHTVEVARQDASCVDGWVQLKCKYCSDVITEVLPATESHTGGVATCQHRAVCEVCGNEYGELGDHTGGTATCQSRAKCEVCGEEYGELGDHTGGTATCQSRAKCEVCGEEYGKLGGHSFSSEWTVDQAPTCTEAGSQSHHCTVPGCTETEGYQEISATGHSGGTATCQKRAVCSVCGQEYGNLGPHSYSSEWTVDQAPTCTKAGSQSHHCIVAGCTSTQGSQAISATGHTWTEWTTKTEATALQAETQTRNCTVCNVTETRTYGAKLTPTITLTAKSLVMKVKQSTTKFSVSGFAKGDSLKSVVSKNISIVKVSKVKANGTFKLTAQKKAGSTKLTITLASGLKKTITVKVQKGAVKTTSITNVAKKATVQKGKSITLKPVLAPVTSQDKITYTSSNKKIATVSSKGVVEGKKPGTAKITIKAGSKKIVCKVTVKGITNKKLTGVKSAVTLKKGKTYTLKPKRSPSNSTDEITYSSSKKSVAVVSAKGKITAKKKGTAVITVKCGKAKVTCKVTVK